MGVSLRKNITRCATVKIWSYGFEPGNLVSDPVNLLPGKLAAADFESADTIRYLNAAESRRGRLRHRLRGDQNASRNSGISETLARGVREL